MDQSRSEVPRAPRIPLNRQAILITSDGNQLDVVVANVSAQGFRMKAEETLYDGEIILVGESVIVRMDRHDDLTAEIKWVSGCELGGVFLDPPKLP